MVYKEWCEKGKKIHSIISFFFNLWICSYHKSFYALLLWCMEYRFMWKKIFLTFNIRQQHEKKWSFAKPPYIANLHWVYIPSVKEECEGWISRAIAQLCIKYCNPQLKWEAEFKGDIVGACLIGSRVTKTASLCGLSRAMVSRVKSAYQHVGWTTSNKSDCRYKRKVWKECLGTNPDSIQKT